MDGNSNVTAAGDAHAVGRVRKRAPEACTFCRRRKARSRSLRPVMLADQSRSNAAPNDLRVQIAKLMA